MNRINQSRFSEKNISIKKIMKFTFLFPLLFFCFHFLFAQEVEFVEYDLDNGLHVILHQDNNAPIVVTSVLYHVGSKDELEDRTGFAHFFEHLLFEGSEI